MEQEPNTEKPLSIKVYRYGRLDRWEMVKPHLRSIGNKIDHFFVNGHWPR